MPKINTPYVYANNTRCIEIITDPAGKTYFIIDTVRSVSKIVFITGNLKAAKDYIKPFMKFSKEATLCR